MQNLGSIVPNQLGYFTRSIEGLRGKKNHQYFMEHNHLLLYYGKVKVVGRSFTFET